MDAVSEDYVLSEKVAIEITKSALERKGIDVASLKPLPYWESSHAIFARSSAEQSTGYVLWGTNQRAQYSVTVRKSGNSIFCKVGKTK